MALLRRAAQRPSSAISQQIRCAGGGAGPVKPFDGNYPLTHEKVMGRHGFGKGSYSFWSLKNPIRGPLYRPPWVVGGIHNPTIDPERHFNQQDRFLTVGFGMFVKCFFYALLPARVQI